MRRLGFAMLIATAGLLVAGDAPEDAVKKEREKLKGEWQITSFERNGEKPFGEEPQTDIKTTFAADGKLKVDVNGETNVEATTTIDPTKKPKTIDFVFTRGELDGQKSLGIYELTDDTFKYCRAAPDKPRPTEFSAKEGSEQTLVVYKRAKSK